MARRKTLSVTTFPWRLSAALLLLTCCSFAISYQGLVEFARAHQISHALLWPLIIDGTITACSVVALMSELAGRNGRGYARAAVAMTALSVALNVAQVWEQGAPRVWLTYVAHAIAPAMILVLLDVLLRQAAHSARAVRTVVSAPGSSSAPRRRAATSTLTREQAAAAVAEHGSRRAAARALGCAWRTLQRALD